MKSKLPILLILLLSLTISVSCRSIKLTPSGQAVKYATKEEPPKNCEMLDMVEVKPGWGGSFGYSTGEVNILLRNKAAALGGNFLVIDVIEARTNYTVHGQNINAQTIYVGNGRAFKCPGPAPKPMKKPGP